MTSPPPTHPSPPPPPPPLTGESHPPKADHLPAKTAALEAKIAGLQAEVAANQAREEEIRGMLKTSSPSTTVQKHITLLHEYNRIRDIGTGLMGIVAENRGVRVRDVYQEFGVGEGD